MLISFYFNGIIPFGKKTVMAIDFSQQFIDFFIFFKNKIFTGDFGNLFYSFSKSLGGNFIGVWSYYLNSPLNILYAFTPLKFINHTTALIILIRYGLMGLTFTYFLFKRHNAAKYNQYLIIALSAAYALSGYNVSYQVVPIFYDVFWLMPLVLVSLEELLDGENPVKYVLLLAVTVFIQYYMGYMMCIFIVMYSVYYLISKRETQGFGEYFGYIMKSLIKVGAYSVLSIGLISWIFIPNVINLLGSKALPNTMRFAWKLQIKPSEIFSKFFIGAFDNTSWPAGPNLPNIYVGALALVGVLLFFTLKNVRRQQKIAAGVIYFIFFISIVNEFVSKIWHLGQNPAGFFYRFSWLICFFLILTAYYGLREVKSTGVGFFSLCLILTAGVTASVLKQKQLFLEPYQIWISAALFIVMAFLIYSENIKDRSILILTLTLIELTANATISQADLPFNDGYHFNDAVEVIDTAIDRIRPSGSDFYRISKSFTRSKNDPLTFDYPGLTHFSSNLEVNIRDFLDYTGSDSVDMSTHYAGTPLTDALFSVRYYITDKGYIPHYDKDPNKLFFANEDVERPDLIEEGRLKDETERFNIYEIPETLPVAFGTPDTIKDVHMIRNAPSLNQENIAQSIVKTDGSYFTDVPETQREAENIQNSPDSKDKYSINSESESRIRIRFTPDSDDPYYAVIPDILSDYENKYNFFLNGQSIKLRRKFTVSQLITLASHKKGEEQLLEMVIAKGAPVDLTGFKIVKLNMEKVNALISSRKAQGLTVEKWGSNFIKGSVNITDDSTMMLTSIPYDKGWTVTVDGKKAEPVEVYGCLMAFPVTKGQHAVNMRYISPGFFPGLGISIMSLAVLIFLIRKTGFKFRLPKRKQKIQ